MNEGIVAGNQPQIKSSIAETLARLVADRGATPNPLDAVPQALREHRAWLIWKRVWDPKSGKWRKIPWYARGEVREGTQGGPDDLRQLVTFDEALAAAKRRSGFDGVGFATLDQFGVVALDFDGCVDADGRVHPDVLALVADTYAEISPSGRGVRAFMVGRLADGKSHGEPFGFEIFHRKGFVTVTGNALPHVERLQLAGDVIAPVSAAVAALHAVRIGNREHEAAETVVAPVGLTREQILQVLARLDPSTRYEPWLRVGMAIHHETAGEGFDLWDDWSAGGATYPGSDALRSKWDSFGRGGQRPVTGGQLLQLAREHQVSLDMTGQWLDDFEVIEDSPTPARPDAKAWPAPKPLIWSAMPEDPPAPVFVIPGWLPLNVVTLLSAHGGTGKSFLSLYIGLCLATGRHPFVEGATLPRVRVVLYSAEDDTAVMHWRLVRYMRLLGIERGDLEGWLLVLDATGANNVLFCGEERRAEGRTTPAYDRLKAQVADFGATVLIFDNASDALDANENDRAKVRQFMSAMKRLAPAVLLLAHVDAVSSMADPSDAKGYSGSTAWHNSARSRWFMARVKDSDDVVLTLPKVNSGKAGSEVLIQWSDADKVFRVISAREGRVKAADNRTALLDLLRQIIEDGESVSPATTTQKSAFSLMKDRAGFPRGLKSRDVAREVMAWRADGLVRIEQYETPQRKPGERLVLTDAGRAALEVCADERLE